MRIFSYRNKRTLRRIALIALLAVVLLGLLILARISYLGRYVVYSPNGVYFDKTQKLQRTPQTPEAPADAEDYPFETILSAAAEETDVDPNAVQLQGFYISTTMLANSVDEVRQALADADGYNAVLIDVKSPLGNFYYSTDIADAQTADADIAACDALIKELTETPDLIVIARVPAFSDPNFVAKHYSSALTTTSGGATGCGPTRSTRAVIWLPSRWSLTHAGLTRCCSITSPYRTTAPLHGTPRLSRRSPHWRTARRRWARI